MRRYSTEASSATYTRFWPLLGLLFLLLGLAGCAPGEGIFSGGSWQAGSLQDQHLHVLSVDPNNLLHLYAGDASSGVFVSTDAGISWKPSSTGLPIPVAIYALSFDPPGKTLYAATEAGLFASSDFAGHWHAIDGLPADSYTTLAFNVDSPQTLYVGSTHSGVWKSSNAGADWTDISKGLPARTEITSLLYDANSKHLWAGFADALYRSPDDGGSWQSASNGLPANAGVNALAVGDITNTTSSLLFAGTNHGFFRSTDDGQHWAPSQASLAALHIRAILLDGLQPSVVYVSTDIGVLRSSDNGQNWSQIASGLPASEQPIEGLVQGGDSYSQLFVASHGIYRYPGSGSPFDPSRLIPIVIILLFFALLYRFSLVRRRRLRQLESELDGPPAENVGDAASTQTDSTAH